MSQKLKNTSGECGYFLLGYVVRTGEQIVVLANKSFYNVTPPASGELWVTVPGKPTDIRIGDEARVSLAQTNPPYRATVVNLYRKDEGAKPAAPPKSASRSLAKDGGDDGTEKPKPTLLPNNKVFQKAKIGEPLKTSAMSVAVSPAEAQFQLGINMLANGKREAAMEHFNKARQADPSESMSQRIADALAGKSLKSSEPKKDD